LKESCSESATKHLRIESKKTEHHLSQPPFKRETLTLFLCSLFRLCVCVLLGCIIMMGGSEDPNNKGDSPFESSATQPFLSKPSYPSSASSAVEEESESNQQYLHITYNSGPRSFKDLPFLILFLLFVISTFAFGIFAVFHRNDNYPSLSSFSYDPTSSSCVLNPSSTSSSLSSWLSLDSSSHLVKGLIWTLVITFVLSIPLCWALLLLLKHYTKQIVYAAIPFFIAIPIFLNVYWFVACTLGSSCSTAFPLAYRVIVMVFVFLVIGVVVWILVVNWHRVELTVSIIGVASHALSRNLNLFGVLPCLIVGLLAYYVPIVVFMVFSKFNGKIAVKNLESGYACVWKEDSWVPAYFALAILTMLWSAAAMIEAQVYVISGTIANWYFTKDHETPKRSIRTSLRSTLLLLPYICLLISCFIWTSLLDWIKLRALICLQYIFCFLYINFHFRNSYSGSPLLKCLVWNVFFDSIFSNCLALAGCFENFSVQDCSYLLCVF